MTSEETILITGATGFLGSHLTHACLKAGYRVCALRRKSSNLWRLADIADSVCWYDAEAPLEHPFQQEKRIHHIIHTATNYGRCGEKDIDIVATNLLFPLRLLDVAMSFNVETFFNTDTVLFKYLNTYSLSKKHFTEWLTFFAEKQKVVNIQLEHIYGPFDSESKFITSMIQRCLENVESIPLTAGEQHRDFIYIKDAVDAYLCLLNHSNDFSNSFTDVSLGSGESIQIKELVNMIGELTHTTSQFHFGALPYRDNEVMESKADVRFLQQLGWSPNYRLTDGLKATITAYKNRNPTMPDCRGSY